jgi:hypothetical protein
VVVVLREQAGCLYCAAALYSHLQSAAAALLDTPPTNAFNMMYKAETHSSTDWPSLQQLGTWLIGLPALNMLQPRTFHPPE